MRNLDLNVLNKIHFIRNSFETTFQTFLIFKIGKVSEHTQSNFKYEFLLSSKSTEPFKHITNWSIMGDFPKFQVLYCSQNTVKSIKIQ